MDRRLDLIVALAFAAFGAFVCLQASTIDTGVMRDGVGPRAFFYGTGALIAAGGLWIAARRLRLWTVSGPEADDDYSDDEAGYPASAGRAFAIIGLSLAYAVLFNPLGYLFATPLYVGGVLFAFGKRSLLHLLVTPLLYTASSYLIFAQFLNVRLPVGPLTGLFRDLGWIIL